MTDIITKAQKLLAGATPGPWAISNSMNPDYPELQAAPRVENGILMVPVLIHDIYGEVSSVEDAELIAAAPEMAQVLASLKCEYTQEIFFDGKWQPIYEDLWFETPEECDGLWLEIEPWKWNNEPLRIVRRLVSPVEEIE